MHPSVDPLYFVLAVAGASIALGYLNGRYASPVMAIFNRWLRWISFSLCGAFVSQELELIDRPFWVLSIGFFLVWFLIDTAKNWVAIYALSQSPMPLFPRYALNLVGDEWPTQPRILELRDWFRAEKYTQIQALKAEVGGGIYLRVSIYQDPLGVTRVQVMFVPQANGAVAVCGVISTQTASGQRFITDNLYLPFGGFYPENWSVTRKPWTRNLPRLIETHQKRIAESGDIPVPWEGEPLADLNQQQFLLEQINTELGFLHPHAEREEFGKMTSEGRYRVWIEIWLLNYFGITPKH
ncbi:MAG TPA: hypothetical protein VKC60_10915 [Opitutaceae bacterium]|nr:hypothetical protein [Opitutaceae bacterium]